MLYLLGFHSLVLGKVAVFLVVTNVKGTPILEGVVDEVAVVTTSVAVDIVAMLGHRTC